MSFENFPTPSSPNPKPEQSDKKKNVYRNLLGGFLILALAGTWGYIIWDKQQTKEEKQALTSQISSTDAAKNSLQQELNDATLQLDMLKSANAKNEDILKNKYSEIEELKTRIQTILNQKNATAAQLSEARKLISQLKGSIEVYTAEIEKLKGENIQLTEQKRVVTEERDVVRRHFDSAKIVIKEKEDVIDIGSTLHASNLTIQGIKERNNGKEKETTTAKRVDKLRISFSLDENRIAQSGNKEIYVVLIAPDGKPVAISELGSGTFKTRDGAEKYFTKKMEVNYTQGEKSTVNFDWKLNNSIQTGNFKIEVYNNGFKIGESTHEFKKGGIFG